MVIKEYTDYSENEIVSLYSDVGWVAYTKDAELLCKAFANSLYTLAAYENGELLGIVRTVGYGCTIVFVQDILVFNKHQRKGVGSALLKAVLQKYSQVRQIELATDNTPKTVAFYRSMGFKEMSEVGCCGFIKM